MPDITPAPASLLEAVFTPMTEYTHNVYSVKGDRLAMTLTKIGVAQANSQGDIQLFINPDCATGKVLLYSASLLDGHGAVVFGNQENNAIVGLFLAYAPFFTKHCCHVIHILTFGGRDDDDFNFGRGGILKSDQFPIELVLFLLA